MAMLLLYIITLAGPAYSVNFCSTNLQTAAIFHLPNLPSWYLTTEYAIFGRLVRDWNMWISSAVILIIFINSGSVWVGNVAVK